MGGQEGFLIDTSAAARLQRPGVLESWAAAVRAGLIGMCPPTEAELLYSARSVTEMNTMAEQFSRLYVWRSVPDDAWRRLGVLQRELATGGCHRSAGVVDLLVAATALHHGLTVLHYDRDFEAIAKHTELKTRWLAEPGSID